MSDNYYNHFLIEIRPRLQSINVIVNFKKPLKLPRISLCNGSITISDECTIYKIPCRKINIVSDSLNSLSINNNFISFRFLTRNATFGSFKSEILHVDDISCNVKSNSFQSNFFNNNIKMKIQCINCSQIFSENFFKRILPLPSEHSEFTDWFCHGHNSNANEILNPQENDIFYSYCYINVHANIMGGLLKSKTNLVCNRCLAWVGITLSKNCFKIWCHTVQISDGHKLYSTLALDDVCLTIRNILKDSIFNSAKIMLQSFQSENKINYLALWIIEKKLSIIKNDDDRDFRELYVAKTLFKFFAEPNNLINDWINDNTVTSVDISRSMMANVLKYLHNMNKLLPSQWNSSNNFFVSYLPLYSDR